MKVKIYIGETVIKQEVVAKKFYFTSSPASGGTDTVSFDYYTNYPLIDSVLTVVTPINNVPIPYSNEEMAEDFVSDITVGGEWTEITATHNSGDTFVTVTMNNGSPIFNVVYSNSFGYVEDVYGDVAYDDFNLLDLFSDENIGFTTKLSDIEKLSNVFLDFSDTFSLPATPTNNRLFKHYYDVDVDNTFNANIRVLGYIEIDSFPFRFGKIQLESVTVKNQRPENYKITFYGGLKQITDLFGDDTIDKLDYIKDFTTGVTELTPSLTSLSKFDYDYNESNFFQTFNDPSFGPASQTGNIITPLISYTDRDWAWGSNNSIDIGINAGKILSDELRPAIRVTKLIEAIEAKYGISFTRSFLGKAVFNNLFMWMNENNDSAASTSFTIHPIGPLVPIAPYPDNGKIVLTDNLITVNTTGTNYAYVRYRITPTNLTYKYDVRIVDVNGNVIFEILDTSGLSTLSASILPNGLPTELRVNTYRLEISPKITNTFSVNLEAAVRNGYYGATLTAVESLNNSSLNQALVIIEKSLPKMKVIDFFQGLMKMFKLIIRPLSPSQFYLNTLDGYYSEGNILDITDFVNQETVDIERPLIYRNLYFQYQKTNNIAGVKFRETFSDARGYDYGDLKAQYVTLDTKEELKVELPFENMMFERMIIEAPNVNALTPTNISIGQSISTTDNITFTKNKSKPILFFNNGITNIEDTPIKVAFGATTTISAVTNCYLIGNSNDELLPQVTDSINWGAEIDPWHLVEVDNSLFLNYWSNWVDTIYDKKQRKFTFEANLPPRYVQELSLNDRLIINNNRYKINDYTIDLSTGKSKLTLFNDIFDWNEYSFTDVFNYTPRKFGPDGWFLFDYNDNSDGTAYVYGFFTSYDSNPYGYIIKLKENGDVDTSFAPTSGFDINSFSTQSILVLPNGKVMASGNFTSFDGVTANRIIRLNSDGTIDTSFSAGTGFNNITLALVSTNDSKIVVGGLFSSYNGDVVTRNRIIRLNSDGTIDNSLVTGTGFNSVTTSIVINSDNSMYVGGYFSSYAGVAANRIIKLSSNGAVDTSFDYGSGLNSNSANQPVGLISDGADGIYIYGYFTTYSGQAANRIVKVLPTGDIDPTFVSVNGFNNAVYSGVKVLGDKLLLQGFFTSYNGLTANRSIILNTDGSVYRTFDKEYLNIYTMGNRFYGNLLNGDTELIADETLPILSTNSIIANAGMKYYGIGVLKNQAWTLSKIDLGYGIDWVTLSTTSGTGAGEAVIRIEDKTNQTAPALNNPRYMDLVFNFNGSYRSVRITQTGL